MQDLAETITQNYFDFLDTIVTFVKDNYAPIEEVTEVQLRDYFMHSYSKGQILPFIVGDQLVAVYEIWLITQEYFDKLESMPRGSSLPHPTLEDREGHILFTPLAVIAKEFLGKGFGLTRIMATKLALTYPNHDGVYRWVLDDGRLGFLSFRRK